MQVDATPVNIHDPGGGGGAVTVTMPDLTNEAYLLENEAGGAPWIRGNTDIPGGSRFLLIGGGGTGPMDLMTMFVTTNTLSWSVENRTNGNFFLSINSLAVPTITAGNSTDGGVLAAHDGIVCSGGPGNKVSGAAISMVAGSSCRSTQGPPGGSVLWSHSTTTIGFGSSGNTLMDVNVSCNAAKFVSIVVGGVTKFKADSTGIVFFGDTTIAQVANIGALTNNTTGAITSAIAAVAGSGADAALNDIHASLLAKINALEQLVEDYALTAP